MVQALEVARLLAALAELIEQLQALAIEHGDVRVAVVGHVEELLVLVGGERHTRGRLRRRTGAVDEHLRDVFPFRREHLHAAVGTIGDVDEPVVRHLHAVRRPAELARAQPLDVGGQRRGTATTGTSSTGGRRRSRSSRATRARAAGRRSSRTGSAAAASSWRRHHVDRRVAERAPLALERTGVGVEHDHAAVAVAVGHERFIRLRPHEDVGRLVHALGVGVALAHAPAADLQQELPLVVELQEHVVVEIAQRRRDRRAAADPDVVLVVDGDAVLAVGPVVAGSRARPRRSRTAPSRRTPAPAAPRSCACPRAACSAGAAGTHDRGCPHRPMPRGPSASCSAASASSGPLRRRASSAAA